MRVEIWKDERYPDYGISVREASEYANAEISEDLYSRYKAAGAAYDIVQDELQALLNGSR